LTGLANRRAFIAGLEARLATRGGGAFALALLDLDGFKPVNDTFGHAAGDALLIEVSARLQDEADPAALVARIGGDEFALLLPCTDEVTAMAAGRQICAALGQPFSVGGRVFRISACCGVILLEPGESDSATALSRGDAALYSGKKGGRGSVALFTPAIEQANQRRIAIERALRDPEVHARISLSYQPIFDLSTGAPRAFEALARWTDPELGPVSPAEFVPIAEQINVIEAISDALLARAAKEASQWPDSVRLSYNLSAVQLCSVGSAARLLGIAAAAGLDPARLQIEVTETAMLADFETARRNLAAMRADGAYILLDDFGAGFASISYLREMIFDAIKIDGSLLSGVPDGSGSVRLLKGVLELCRALRVPCVAEHIENAEQHALLRKLGCQEGQGFGLSPPLTGAEARALVAPRLIALPKAKRLHGRRAA
jgi:diguanylate cyclase (GGDEF)-like protein